MEKQEAQDKIAALVDGAMKNIREAEKLAVEHGLSFSFDIAYGMGGTFYPGEKHDYLETYWHPSSHSC